MMLDGPICENVLQSLDMTTPKPRFWKSQDQLLLQDTMESGPPEAPIWAKSDPSSCMIVICINENGVRSAADPPCEYQKWRNSINCCYKLILREIQTSNCDSMLMMFGYKKSMLEQAWKETSGDLKFSRKCCNGLTNRHLASGHIMTMKR